MNKINTIVLALALITLLCGTASADIYVGPGENEATIQGAVNNASVGDTIIVRDGTYYENVNVSTSSLTIRSENGSANCFVNASDPEDHVFDVSVDYVNISGFTVRNATEEGAAGIYLGSEVDHCVISENTISNNDCGIYLDSSTDNSISNNICKNNGVSDEEGGGGEEATAIHLEGSENNLISNNNCSENDDGIALVNSDNNTVINNTVNSNEYTGISLDSSTDNRILDNTCKNNGMNVSGAEWTGIHLEDSDNNLISNNNCNENDHGIFLGGSHNNTLTNNTASYNTLGYDTRVGIYLIHSNNNTLTNNTASHNGDETLGGYGIYLQSSSDNTLTNNTANSNCYCDGIYLQSSSDNTLTNNTAKLNSAAGIHLSWSSSNNTLTENTASDNCNGIYLDSLTIGDNTLANNTVNSNDYVGISVYQSDGNNITGNTVNSNELGIRLYASINNNVTCNWVAHNDENGFYLGGSSASSQGYSVDNNISRNNIIANGVENATSGGYEWQFKNDQPVDVDAIDNWWGTDNGSIIAASINETTGSVDYEPFETATCPCAPIPELATIALLAVGLLALVGYIRIGRKK